MASSVKIVDKELDVMDILTKVDALNTTVCLFDRIEWVGQLISIRNDMLWTVCQWMACNPAATGAAITAGVFWWYRDQILEQLTELAKRISESGVALQSKFLESISIISILRSQLLQIKD